MTAPAKLGHNSGARYTRVREALRNKEGANWIVGDLLVEEYGPPDPLYSDLHKFRDWYDRLTEEGFDVQSPEYLRRLRDMALIFPPEARRRDISYTCYNEARTPDVMARAIKLAEESGRNLTHRFIRNVRSLMEENARLAAPVDLARARAHSQLDHVEPEKTALDVTIDGMDLNLLTSEASLMADKHMKAVEKIDLSSISPLFIDVSVQEVLKTAETYRLIAERLRGHATKKGRAHLHSVE